MTQKILVCSVCSTEFTRKGMNNIYCSKSCRKKNYESKNQWAKWSRTYQERHQGKRLIQVARSRAKRRGFVFDLSQVDIEVPETCPILGIKLEISKGQGGAPSSPSLDKIVNELGYVDGNVQVISHLANSMKSHATKEQLIMFANWIISNEDIL